MSISPLNPGPPAATYPRLAPLASALTQNAYSEPLATVNLNRTERFETEAKKAIGELAELADTHDITIFCENEGERKRFCELVELENPGLCARLDVPVGYLHP